VSEVVKTLKEGKGVDRQLVSAMLDEAKAALSDASKLPESEASAYKAQVASLEQVQKDRLRSVEAQLPPGRRHEAA
jgi:predicted GNAT family acetyltransferase